MTSEAAKEFSYWWKDLRKIYHQSQHSIFYQNMVWKIGCGDRINFWTDRWAGESTLKQQYNQLFMISSQQHSLISMMGNFSQDNWRWDLKWRRNLFDHEHDLAMSFMEDITSIYIQRNVKDIMMWKAEPNGVYSTKSAYSLMLKSNVSGSQARISKLIWNLKIPPRQQFSFGDFLRTGSPLKGIF